MKKNILIVILSTALTITGCSNDTINITEVLKAATSIIKIFTGSGVIADGTVSKMSLPPNITQSGILFVFPADESYVNKFTGRRVQVRLSGDYANRDVDTIGGKIVSTLAVGGDPLSLAGTHLNSPIISNGTCVRPCVEELQGTRTVTITFPETVLDSVASKAGVTMRLDDGFHAKVAGTSKAYSATYYVVGTTRDDGANDSLPPFIQYHDVGRSLNTGILHNEDIAALNSPVFGHSVGSSGTDVANFGSEWVRAPSAPFNIVFSEPMAQATLVFNDETQPNNVGAAANDYYLGGLENAVQWANPNIIPGHKYSVIVNSADGGLSYNIPPSVDQAGWPLSIKNGAVVVVLSTLFGEFIHQSSGFAKLGCQIMYFPWILFMPVDPCRAVFESTEAFLGVFGNLKGLAPFSTEIEFTASNAAFVGKKYTRISPLDSREINQLLFGDDSKFEENAWYNVRTPSNNDYYSRVVGELNFGPGTIRLVPAAASKTIDLTAECLQPVDNYNTTGSNAPIARTSQGANSTVLKFAGRLNSDGSISITKGNGGNSIDFQNATDLGEIHKLWLPYQGLWRISMSNKSESIYDTTIIDYSFPSTPAGAVISSSGDMDNIDGAGAIDAQSNLRSNLPFYSESVVNSIFGGPYYAALANSTGLGFGPLTNLEATLNIAATKGAFLSSDSIRTPASSSHWNDVHAISATTVPIVCRKFRAMDYIAANLHPCVSATSTCSNTSKGSANIIAAQRDEWARLGSTFLPSVSCSKNSLCSFGAGFNTFGTYLSSFVDNYDKINDDLACAEATGGGEFADANDYWRVMKGFAKIQLPEMFSPAKVISKLNHSLDDQAKTWVQELEYKIRKKCDKPNRSSEIRPICENTATSEDWEIALESVLTDRIRGFTDIYIPGDFHVAVFAPPSFLNAKDISDWIVPTSTGGLPYDRVASRRPSEILSLTGPFDTSIASGLATTGRVPLENLSLPSNTTVRPMYFDLASRSDLEGQFMEKGNTDIMANEVVVGALLYNFGFEIYIPSADLLHLVDIEPIGDNCVGSYSIVSVGADSSVIVCYRRDTNAISDLHAVINATIPLFLVERIGRDGQSTYLEVVAGAGEVDMKMESGRAAVISTTARNILVGISTAAGYAIAGPLAAVLAGYVTENEVQAFAVHEVGKSIVGMVRNSMTSEVLPGGLEEAILNILHGFTMPVSTRNVSKPIPIVPGHSIVGTTDGNNGIDKGNLQLRIRTDVGW